MATNVYTYNKEAKPVMYDKYFRVNNCCYKCKYWIPNFSGFGYCQQCQDTHSDDYCSYYEDKDNKDKEE